MSLLPWRKPSTTLSRSGGSPMSLLQQEMNNFFDQVFGGSMALEGPFGGINFPAVSIADTDDNIIVTAEMPGIDADDLNIRVDNDILTLSGVKREETQEEKENVYRVERMYGSFTRRITLPSNVNPDKVKANLKNGVLKLEMAKMAGDTGKSIKIQAS